jgi:hypothetical protein
MGNSCKFDKKIYIWENVKKIITKLENFPKYISFQSMDPKFINFNAKYHNVILPNQYIQNPQLQCYNYKIVLGILAFKIFNFSFNC